MYYNKKNIYISDDKKTLFNLNKNDIYEINREIFNKFEEIYYSDNPQDILKDEGYTEIYEAFFRKTFAGFSYNSDIYQLKIHTSNICNLDCKYCDTNKWNNDMENKVMSRAIAKRICDLICNNFHNLATIVFYGGEPLLGIDAIEEICETLKERNIDFTINTNLTILNDKIIDIINRYNISITASIDGPKEIHDANRIYKETGMGSYDIVHANAKQLIEKTNSLNAIVATYTLPGYKKYTKEQIVEFIYKEYNVKNVSIGNAVTKNVKLRIPDKNQYNEVLIEKEVQNLFTNIINGKYVDLGYASIPLTTFFSKCNAENFCTAGITSILIMPNGDMWPCRAFIGNKEFYMGNLNCDYMNLSLIKFKEVKESLQNIEKSKLDKCSHCIAKFWCVKCVGKDSPSKEDILNNVFSDICIYNEKLTISMLEQIDKILKNGQFQIFHDNLEKSEKYVVDNC